MKALLAFCLVPFVLGFTSMLLHPSKARFTAPEPGEGEVRLIEIRSWVDPILWVDARESGYFDKEHIPEAFSLNENNFEEHFPLLLEKWEPGTRIVVYCDAQLCDASHAIADRLRNEVGLPDVWVLYGGWSAWKYSN